MKDGNEKSVSSESLIGKKIWWWLGLIVYYCWFQALYNALHFGRIWVYSSYKVFLYGVTCNILPIAAIWWVYILIVFRRGRYSDRILKVFVDLILAFLIAIAVNVCFAFVFPLFTGRASGIDWSGTLLNDFLVLTLMEMIFYFKSTMSIQREMEEMQKQVMRHRYDALKAQVNPHFLFNSFNLLYSLVVIDPPSARVFIQNLAEMYRYILDRHGREIVSANEELVFIRSYIVVLETRYKNKFTVVWNWISVEQEELEKVYLIPFSLQILLENVVKHNVVSTKSPMEVNIEISRNGIAVSNPVHLRQSASVHSSGFGLTYLSKVYNGLGREMRIDNDTATGSFEVFLSWIKADDLSELRKLAENC